MRNIFIFYLFPMSVGSGLATIDPDSNQLGIYFDDAAETVCIDTSPNIPFFANLVVTIPTVAEIWGIEFSMCTEFVGGDEHSLFKLGEEWSAGFVDLGVIWDWCLDGRLIGFVEPVPQAGPSVVVARLHYILLSDMSVEFYLGPHPNPRIADGLPAILDGNGEIFPLGISSGSSSLPVAVVNGDCSVVSSESKSFGGLKCLYR